MSRAMIVVRSDADRARAMALISKAPPGTRIEFKAAKRTIPQNDRMWAMLTDVSRQLVWYDKKLRPEDWKLVFLNALKRENYVPNIDGTGFVNIGTSSSDLSKQEMRDLMTIIEAFCAQHGVRLRDDEQEAA